MEDANKKFFGTTGLAFEEGDMQGQSRDGRRCLSFKPFPVEGANPQKLYGNLARKSAPGLPELAEVDVVRHFTRLSIQNYSKDLGFYPLGSCTMKHNPRIANKASAMHGFADSHPYQPESDVQGNLELCYELEAMLAEISGMDAVTLWPAAGSHGELTGMLIVRAYHASRGNPRKKVIIPDSAHGTNPASAAICHYEVVQVKSGENGLIDTAAMKAAMDEDVAAVMITNPNTLGLFEKNFDEVSKIVHGKGGLVYLDGANLNALMGYVKPGKIGADVMHFNLHKTFGTPHGGGGPGAGPVGVVEKLRPFLPSPRIAKSGGAFKLSDAGEKSIGRINTFFGNFAVLVRAYTYIKELGAEGLKDATEMAVLNANYIKARLRSHYDLPYDMPVLHECVFSDKIQNEYGVKTLDIAKRLMDYGFHPPTVYFPLIVHGAIMIEPTETESKDVIDGFCDAMIAIAKECAENPDIVKAAPTRPFRRRIDEVRAARDMCLKD
jgi:glycine dehydrogenase subunit 2